MTTRGSKPGPVTAAIRQLQPGEEIALRDVSRRSVAVLAHREAKRTGARIQTRAFADGGVIVRRIT